MNWVRSAQGWLTRTGNRLGSEPKIGLALGGGFARGIAHVGVLRVLGREGIRLHCIGGVSAGSIVAAAYASGASPDEIEVVARSMRFRDVARWTMSWEGLAGSERMSSFLARLLKKSRFEDMKIPLAVVATDICAGKAALFRDRGDVVIPIRASCSYPGLFLPIRDGAMCLVDGMVSMEVPAGPLRQMGATHVISVALPNADGFDGGNMLSVINRCFQVMSRRSECDWRRESNLVIEPQVAHIAWDGFVSSKQLIEAGEKAAEDALPAIRQWLQSEPRKVSAPPRLRTSEQAAWLG